MESLEYSYSLILEVISSVRAYVRVCMRVRACVDRDREKHTQSK